MKIFENVDVTGKILSPEEVRLFSDLTDPHTLDQLPAEVQASYIRRGEELLDSQPDPLPAGFYLAFTRMGSRSVFEDPYFNRRRHLLDLVLAEALEQNGRFANTIVDYLWAILEETTWVLPAHTPEALCREYGPTVTRVDLFSAATAGLLTFAVQLLGDRLERDLPAGLMTDRIEYEVERRVLHPVQHCYIEWMDVTANNWNPWIFSNVLFCMTAFIKEPPRREAMVARVLSKMDNFVARYGEDGGCEEGPNYWNMAGGCFFDCLEILYDLSGGRLNFFGNPMVKRMGEYITRMYIHGRYFVPFADASHRLNTDNLMIARFGRRTGSEPLACFGLSRLTGKREDVILNPSNAYRSLKNLAFFATRLQPAEYRAEGDYYYPNLQVMTARQYPQTDRGLFLAIKGGHNAESHNHNDVGSFVVYYNGEPLLIDPGVDSYSKTTFSPQRYSLWHMQSGYHNLPDINGTAEKDGAEYRPASARYDAARRELELELCTAYPGAAGIRSFVRTARMEPDGSVTVTDRLEPVQKAVVEEHLMLRQEPDLSVPGQIRLPHAPVIYYDPRLTAAKEAVSTLTRVDLAEGQDPHGQLARSWESDWLYRVTLTGTLTGPETFTLRVR